MNTVRILSEADIVEAELERKRSEVDRLSRRLAELRGHPVPMQGDVYRQQRDPTFDLIDDGNIIPLAELERRYILRVLAKLGGNRTHTARALGIGTNTLWRKLKAWGEPPAREH